MKFLNFSKVLCLAPHPDDAEYSIAATIMQHPETHFDILCLTQGGRCDKTTSESRHKEVVDSWKKSQATNYTLLFSDVDVLSSRGVDQWVEYIERVHTHKNSYDCIMTTSDFDSHHEHVTVSTLAAPLCRAIPHSIIQYKSPSTLETWIPNLFVTVDEECYKIKKSMLMSFVSQKGKPYFKDNVFDGFHTNYQCMKKGMGFVESYKIITLYK
jgi:LmbE family N-acetylglucosaminyl deacetylase